MPFIIFLKTRYLEVDFDKGYDFKMFFFFLTRLSFRKALSCLFRYDCPISKEHRGIWVGVLGLGVYWFWTQSPSG